MRVCKGFYNILNSSAPFYNLNEFHFNSDDALLVYLSSITPARVKDLRDITVPFGPNIKTAFTLLSTCTELRNLKLRIRYHLLNCFSTPDGYETIETITKDVRCCNFQLELLPDLNHSATPTDETNRATLEDKLKKKMTSRPPVEIKDHKLTESREISGVQVHGDGRLEGEMKPGLVSSRTRGGRARQARVNEDGLVEKEPMPKFGCDGSLLWDVMTIKDHKEVVDGQTSESKVELLVKWQDPVNQRLEADSEQSWEDLEVLVTNPNTFHDLYHYYQSNALWGKLGGVHKMLAAAKDFDAAAIAAIDRPTKKSRFSPSSYSSLFRSRLRDHENYLAKVEEDAAKAAKVAAKAAKADGKAAKASKAAAKAAGKAGGKKRKCEDREIID